MCGKLRVCRLGGGVEADMMTALLRYAFFIVFGAVMV